MHRRLKEGRDLWLYASGSVAEGGTEDLNKTWKERRPLFLGQISQVIELDAPRTRGCGE